MNRQAIRVALPVALALFSCRTDDPTEPSARPASPPARSLALSPMASAAARSSLDPRAGIAFSGIPGLDRAYGINAAGLVVGDYGGNNSAAVWSAGSGFRSIGRLDGTTACCSALSAVNAAGVAAGFSHTDGGVSATGWSATGGVLDLQIPGRTYAQDINDAGDVVASDYSGYTSPWYKPNGSPAVLLPLVSPFVGGDPRALTAQRLVVGAAWATDGLVQAVAWPAPDAEPVPLGGLGGDQSWAQGVNESGDIVGWSEAAPGSRERHAVLWPGGGPVVDLSTWPHGCAGASEAADINEAGIIVGRCDGRPVLWTAAEGMRELTSPAWVSTAEPFAINDRNQIVGIVNGFGSAMWTVVLGGAIEAGDRHTCAIPAGGRLLCWGFGDNGQVSVPSSLGPVAWVAPGGYHTCAIRSADATAVCWGENSEGQAQVPAGLGPIRALGAGSAHTCAILPSGQLRCWGRNNEGQTTVPADVKDVVQVDGGVYFTCALLQGGTVRCWGSNIDENTNPSGQINVPPGLSGVTAIAVGFYGVCALASAGVTCWGRQSPPPSDLGQVIQIGSTNHNCGLRTDGSLRCWGFDLFGQIAVPSGLGPVTRVAVGGYHTCALRQDGTVACWGIDQFGELQVPSELRPTLAAQRITFTSTPPSPAIAGGAYALSADGGGSGNLVTFGTRTPSVCTVTGASATLLQPGTCTVTANQAGTALYAPAPEATQGFSVVPANSAPVANAGGPYAGTEGATISFDGTASSDPDGNAVSYAWTFGDGATVSSTNPAVKPTHAYTDNGTFTVTLTVTDAGGLTSVVTTTATIANVSPTGTFTAPASAPENAKLVLSLAPAADPGSADVLQYAFDCGDGKGFGALTATSNRPCVPADNGPLPVKAKVQDDDGGVTEYAATISVTNVAPTATFTYPTKTIPEGSTFSISLTKPVDAAGDLPSLRYTLFCPFGAGSNAASATCGAIDSGLLGVGGVLLDKDGAGASYNGNVSVTNVAPTVVITGATVTAARQITIAYSVTDPAGARDLQNYCVTSFLTQTCGNGFYTTVNFGDNSTYYVLSPSTATTRTITRTYAQPGNYTITVTATDKDGGTGKGTVRVSVK